MRRIWLVCLLVAFAALPAGAAAAVVQTPPTLVVPSAGLPPEVQVQSSNANLAVTHFKDRVFMVFRTAPTQIAGGTILMYVVSSKDQVHWRYEGQFNFNRDVREPRFLVLHKKLYLYMALLGTNTAGFDPGGTVVTRWRGVNHWTRPRHILAADFIIWQIASHRGKVYMTGYTGGGGTFQPNPPPKYVYFLASDNAIDWRPVGPDNGIVYTGQCGETSFAFRHDGSLVTACQTEEVDKLGWGAKVCTAPADVIWKWTCRGDTRRLDSPFVFVDRDNVYVIARRQVAFDGEYDYLHVNLPDTDAQFAMYDGEYAATTKRCALWKINPADRTFAPIFDVPGVGDTCYPQVIRQPDHRYLVYNYTSPLDGSDPPWGTALTVTPTEIYRQTISFP